MAAVQDPPPLDDLAALADALAHRLAAVARAELSRGLAAGDRSLARPVARGAGDVTFGLDAPVEAALTAWCERAARRGSLSVLSEESGWRHFGPSAEQGFDHGGPRLVVDPIDGTRNLMADLRSAWVSVAACPPGPGPPRLGDVRVARLVEIPTSGARVARTFSAERERGARLAREPLGGGERDAPHPLRADRDDRADHGYFPFFRFDVALRPTLARIEADFFARLAREEGARIEHCYDDQYISNAGQLALLAQGTYRFVADLRAHVGALLGERVATSKPYDVAAAVWIAREAGAVVTAPDGGALNPPLDAAAAVSFVGYANEATRRRLEPHLLAALGAVLGGV